MNKKYIKPIIVNVMVEELMGDHTGVLQTSPIVSATEPGRGGDFDDDDEFAAKKSIFSDDNNHKIKNIWKD